MRGTRSRLSVNGDGEWGRTEEDVIPGGNEKVGEVGGRVDDARKREGEGEGGR